MKEFDMNKLEISFAGVTMRNPLILASATPSWDGERSNLAWRAGAGGVARLCPPSNGRSILIAAA
jgi:hypothetical protein